MRRRRLAAVTVMLACAGLCWAQPPSIPAFTLNGPQGPESFDPHASVATVVVFTSTRCPISDTYNGRLKRLFDTYSNRGVRFLVVNANSNEPAAEVARYRASHPVATYPIYKDEHHTLADQLAARVTPESYVISRTGAVVYRGAIDDSQNEARVRTRSLQDAIDATLAGQPAPHAETKAFGCTIKRTGKTT